MNVCQKNLKCHFLEVKLCTLRKTFLECKLKQRFVVTTCPLRKTDKGSSTLCLSLGNSVAMGMAGDQLN